MDRLVIENGGMPLHGDDFRFIDAGIREALKGVLFGLCPAECILGGLTYTKVGNVYTIASGFVCIGYEIRFVPAQVLTALPNQTIEIHPDDSWNSNGLDVFADNQSRNTYQVRRAKCVAVTAVADTLELIKGPFFKYTLLDLLTSISLSYSNDFQFILASGTYQNEPPLMLTKDGNHKILSGVINMEGANIPNQQNTLIFKINNSSFRPQRSIVGLINIWGLGGEEAVAKITISSNGSVFIYKYPNNTVLYEFANINISFF